MRHWKGDEAICVNALRCIRSDATAPPLAMLTQMLCGRGWVRYFTSEVQCPQRVALMGIVVRQ
jgi:hypothetical protein